MSSGKILTAEHHQMAMLKLIGDVRVLMSSALDNYSQSLYRRGILDALVIDMTGCKGIDSTALGLLAKLAIQLRNRFNITPTIISTNPDITRILKGMSFQLIFTIVEKPGRATPQLASSKAYEEFSQGKESENSVKDKVIDAHLTLMTLSEENRLEFQDLVHSLKNQD
jgi:anti-anti-sigma factor